MRIAAVVIVLGAVLAMSGCMCPCNSMHGPLHNLIWSQTLYWQTRDFEMYAKDMEERVNAGEDISPAEYEQFVRTERMHWHVHLRSQE